jgi:hypothetical protein
VSKLLDRFFAPQPMQALVVSRIVLGLILFTFYAHALPDVPTVWGPEGLGGHALQQRAGLHLDLGGRPLEAPLRWLTANPSMELTWGLYGLLLTSSLAFALGLWTRPAGAVALHFGLEALGNAGWWQPMMSALLLTFVPWQWSSALLAVGRRRKIFRDISGY